MLKLLFLCVLFLQGLFAHPHTFIEVYPTIVVEEYKTKQIRFKWCIDEMTSSMLMMELDLNGDNKIDDKENYFAYKNYFTLLESYDLYTFFKIKDKVQAFQKPTNFKTTLENYKVCYSFEFEKSYDIRDLTIDIADKENFVAIILKEPFFDISGAKVDLSEIDKEFYFLRRIKLVPIQ